MTITFGETIGELILDPLLVGLDKPNLKKVTTTENYLFKPDINYVQKIILVIDTTFTAEKKESLIKFKLVRHLKP